MTFRVVARGANGEIKISDYPSSEEILSRHTQIGIDDCSSDLRLRGLPVFRGLIGPIPDLADIVRYETPDVFEKLTKLWSSHRRKRQKPRPVAEVA